MAKGVSVEGLDKLADALHKAAERERKAAEQAIGAELESVRGDWRSNVRVDTGEYRASIRTRQSGLEGEVRSSVRQALPNEFGTSSMTPRPAATPAALRSRARLPKRLAQTIKTAVERKR